MVAHRERDIARYRRWPRLFGSCARSGGDGFWRSSSKLGCCRSSALSHAGSFPNNTPMRYIGRRLVSMTQPAEGRTTAERILQNLNRFGESIYRLESILSGKTTRLQQVASEELSYSLLQMLAELANLTKRIPSTQKLVARMVLHLDEMSPSSLTYLLGSISRALWGDRIQVPSERFLYELDDFLERANSTLDRFNSQLLARELNFETIHDEANDVVYPYEIQHLGTLPGRAFVATVRPVRGSLTSSDNTGSSEATVPVNGYLDTEDTKLAQRVLASVDRLVEALGYQQVGDREITKGSFIFRSRAEAKETLDEVKKRLFKVERAFELAQLDLRQAQVDSIQAQSVRDLLAQLEPIDRACIQAGSILVVKFPINEKSAVIIRNLTQVEMRILAEYPEIQNTPEGALAALANAVVSSRGAVDDLPAGQN